MAVGGFSSLSLVQTRALLGFDAPPGGTALRGDEWMTGGRRRRSDSSPRGGDVRGGTTPDGSDQSGSARQGFNIWKYTRAPFHSGSAEWGLHITFFTITVSFGKKGSRA